MRVTVRNFYNETVFKKAFKFKLPKDKVLPLDFDSERLGTGVFVLGSEFVLGDKHYRAPYQRFAVIKPLDGTHPTADFYLQLNWNEKSSNAEKLARYSRDLGFMATNWRSNSRFADTNAPEAQLRRKYGIVNRLHILSVELPEMYPDLCKPGMPYHPKSLTNAVPEKVAFIEKAAYEAGMKAAPDDNWWAFYNEEDAEVAPIRYAKTHEERLKACEDWFPYQYACWKGLKRAFDERGIKLMYAPTHGCGNYNPETTPIMFSEGFNVLPFSIPQWDVLAFADFYPHGWTASLDLGWREFLQAGEMARLYIMDLKYWPRLMNSHSWQNRLVADAQMSPVMWNMVPNTLGHLLTSPKFLGDVKRDDWRASAVVLHDAHDEASNLWGAFDRARRNLPRIRLHFACKGL